MAKSKLAGRLDAIKIQGGINAPGFGGRNFAASETVRERKRRKGYEYPVDQGFNWNINGVPSIFPGNKRHGLTVGTPHVKLTVHGCWKVDPRHHWVVCFAPFQLWGFAISSFSNVWIFDRGFCESEASICIFYARWEKKGQMQKCFVS